MNRLWSMCRPLRVCKIYTGNGGLVGLRIKQAEGRAETSPVTATAKYARAPHGEFVGRAAWIEGDWKLHHSKSSRGLEQTQLFDLAHDAAESKNLAEQYPERVAAMLESLTTWQTSTSRTMQPLQM